MSNATLTKVTAKTAAEVCKHFPLGNEARALLRDGLTPGQFLDVLVEKQHYTDAVRFLAHALPKREGIWWACQCSRLVVGATPPPKEAAALQAVEKWVAIPNEDNRRAAEKASEAAGLDTPAGCVAFAAFCSGANIGPTNLPPKSPPIPPGEHATAQAVAGAVMLAAVLTEPDKVADKNRKFLVLGVEVASGTNKIPAK